MAITTPELLLRIRDMVRDGGTRNRYPDEIYVRSGINPTLRELEREAFTRTRTATFLSVAGQAEYPFLTTAGLSALGPIYAVEGVFYGPDERPLVWQERHVHVGPPTSGDPRFWALWNDGLAFDPAPPVGGVTIRVDAYCSPLAVTASSPPSDELGLTPDVEDALVYGSSYRMAIIDSEYARASNLRDQYLASLNALRQKMNPDRGDIPSLVDGSGMDRYFLWF